MGSGSKLTPDENAYLEAKIEETGIVALMMKRKAEDGASWRDLRDSHRFQVATGLSPNKMRGFWFRTEDRLGMKIEKRNKMWRELRTFQMLLDSNGGKRTPETDEEFSKEHPGVEVSHVAASHSRINNSGEHSLTTEHDPVAKVAELKLREPLLMVTQVEKLISRRNAFRDQVDELNVEIGKLDQELSDYQPLIHALESVKSAAEKVRQAQESRSSATSANG